MRNLKSITGIAVFILIFTISNALNAQEIYRIKGKVVDSKTNRLVPFVSVSVCNYPIGIATNEFGEFVLKIPKSLVHENLCVSGIGYNDYTQKISSFSELKYHTIKLEKKIYSIEEVKINAKRKRKFKNPKQIVKLALENIDKNYPKEPFNLQGYYREYLKHGDDNYLNMLEGAVLIEDKGFQTEVFPYNAKLLQVRYNNEFGLERSLQKIYNNEDKENLKYIPGHKMSPLGGNELSILFAHDAVRRYKELTYSFINKFDENFIPNHQFALDSIIHRNDIPIYCISFDYMHNFGHKDNDYKQLMDVKGRIMISSNTYAIERLEYVKYSMENPGMKLYEIKTEYKNYGGKMYLNYLGFSNYFKIPVDAKTANQFNIPHKKRPLQIVDIEVDGDNIILGFNKKLGSFSAKRKGNYEFDGFVLRNSNSKYVKTDTLNLSGNPDVIELINSNKVSLHVPNIGYLLLGDVSDGVDTKFRGQTGDFLYSNSQSKATLTGNTLTMRNVKLTLKGIKDTFGNKFNEDCSIELHQFREFFVNEIPETRTVPTYARDLFNEIPLYKQIPRIIPGFWDTFNYPMSAPLQDNFDTTMQ